MKYGYIYDTTEKDFTKLENELKKAGAEKIYIDIIPHPDLNNIFEETEFTYKEYQGYTKEQISEIAQKKLEGKSLGQLAKEYNTTREKIRCCIKRNDKRWEKRIFESKIRLPPQLGELIGKVKEGDTIIFYNWTHLTYDEAIADVLLLYLKRMNVPITPIKEPKDKMAGYLSMVAKRGEGI